uniref:Centromere protein S n=1 Tax=Saccoglossus kowalevskii TaxID=10224 RepID=A0ABM0MIZ9_SACKO|nr:PREDICTED: centromere protein S-like [Saccoglossus kowalevskii]
MASDDDDEYEQLAYNQRLKAAVHYTVGQICEQFGEKNDVTFSRQLIATISETTYRQSGVLATDLGTFCKTCQKNNHQCR